jgi:hypothetical protein
MAASFGLTPKQHSSGGKERLLGHLLGEPMRLQIHVAVALSAAAVATSVQCQQQLPLLNAPGYTIETHRLPSSATTTIKELPLEVDMELAKKFVTIGFGPRPISRKVRLQKELAYVSLTMTTKK